SVAGPPSRSTATRRRLRRSSTALVACVVPSMTWLIRPGSRPGAAAPGSMGEPPPPGISGVAGTLALAVPRSAVSMFPPAEVAPPSIPRRQSGAGTGELLHWQVVEIVAKRPRSRDRDARLGPPERIAAERDHRNALPVPDPFGRYGVSGLGVQHRDQVRDGG